ncbi:DUF5723 family protein [Flavobacterium cellulosilyticum]|uniref:DUF5723 domain-containing protein n=1 Tax=Flavobacterium cellulosilyticum TaxID=2541731 RepID=A0A4R5CI03_9FLAO|nr:DUF5723 family protein [Flavobacterium cellulosilyticum]TDD98729.1 hypothetical protein E0F76_06270 [Flavobacterium cellulosilyticum]
MRKITLFFVLLVSIGCISQNKQILYNFTSIPQSLLTNPGLDVKYIGFIGIPFLSGVSANVGSSGFSAYDLFAKNGVDFNAKLRNVVFSTSRKDKLAINEQIEVVSGGFKLGDWQSGSYVSFGMYQEMDLLVYMPKDYAIVMLDGNKDYVGKVFDFGDLNARGELLSVFHLGFHKNINEKLILGARGKIYSSIFNIESTNNSGYFYTKTDANTIYEQVISSNVMVNTSGFTNYTDYYSGNTKSDILKKTLLGGNLGLGLDVGLTYYPEKNMQFTASILDVGFIRHTKEVRDYRFKGYYRHLGLTPDFEPGSSGNGIYQDFIKAIPLDTLNVKYTTWRPIKFNTSFQYSFGDGRNSECNCLGNEIESKNAVGAQLFAMTTPRSPLMALTAYYKRQIFKSLEMKATYTLDSFSLKNIGLGLSTTIGKVNFYFLADNLLEYRDVAKANSLSFQFGLNIIFPDKNTPY